MILVKVSKFNIKEEAGEVKGNQGRAIPADCLAGLPGAILFCEGVVRGRGLWIVWQID